MASLNSPHPDAEMAFRRLHRTGSHDLNFFSRDALLHEPVELAFCNSFSVVLALPVNLGKWAS